MALFLGAELTKMMIRMTVTESAPLRYRQGAKQWMVSWELHFGATKPLNQVLVCWDAATLAKGNTTQAVAFAVQQPLDDLPYDRAALRLASLEWLVGRCDEATQKSRMQASGARASNQACHPKTLVRRNQRYTKIDAALREIAGSRPSSLEEVCQSLDGRKIGIPFAEPFVSARGWMAGFERDVKAARSWISKRWGELNLPSFARRGRKGPKK